MPVGGTPLGVGGSGQPGPPGKSAYQLAVQEGKTTLTLDEWLTTPTPAGIVGAKGDPGDGTGTLPENIATTDQVVSREDVSFGGIIPATSASDSWPLPKPQIACRLVAIVFYPSLGQPQVGTDANSNWNFSVGVYREQEYGGTNVPGPYREIAHKHTGQETMFQVLAWTFDTIIFDTTYWDLQPRDTVYLVRTKNAISTALQTMSVSLRYEPALP
jgi:hypothetical protein